MRIALPSILVSAINSSLFLSLMRMELSYRAFCSSHGASTVGLLLTRTQTVKVQIANSLWLQPSSHLTLQTDFKVSRSKHTFSWACSILTGWKSVI
jgi:hypothetical protein